MTDTGIKNIYGDMYLPKIYKGESRWEQIYGRRLMDRSGKVAELAEMTLDCLEKIDGDTNDRIISTLKFLDCIVLRALQLSCIGAIDIRMSSTGFSLLVGLPEEDNLKKLYVGYYLGCGAVINPESTCRRLDYCTLWLTSAGMAASPVTGNSITREVYIIKDPVEQAKKLDFYFLSEDGLNKDGAIQKLNSDAIIKEWMRKISPDRLPINDTDIDGSNNTFTLGAGMLARIVLYNVYSTIGLKGIDHLLYAVYRKCAENRVFANTRSNWSTDVWSSYIFEPSDAKAITSALYGKGTDVLSVFRNLLSAEVVKKNNLGEDYVYAYDDFALFIPTLNTLLESFFNRIIQNYGARLGENILFEEDEDFVRTIFAAQAIYCNTSEDLDNKAVLLARACSNCSELKDFIGQVYDGMEKIDDSASYKKQAQERETFYSELLDSEKHLEALEEFERHIDKQKMLAELDYEEEEEKESLVEHSNASPFAGDFYIEDIEKLTSTKEQIKKELSEFTVA